MLLSSIFNSSILDFVSAKKSFAPVAIPLVNAPYIENLQNPSGTYCSENNDLMIGVHFLLYGKSDGLIFL
jgi:hypothetical protein